MLPTLNNNSRTGLQNLFLYWYPFFSSVRRAIPSISFGVHGGHIRDRIMGRRPMGDIDICVPISSEKDFEKMKYHISNTMGCCPIASEALFDGTSNYLLGNQRIDLNLSEDSDFCNGDYSVNTGKLFNDFRFVAHKNFFEDLENRVLKANRRVNDDRIKKSLDLEMDGFRRSPEICVCRDEEMLEFDIRESFRFNSDIEYELLTKNDPYINQPFLNVLTYPMGFVHSVSVFSGKNKVPLEKYGVEHGLKDVWRLNKGPNFKWDRLEIVDWHGNIQKHLSS